MNRPKVVRVEGDSRADLVAAAKRAREEHTSAASCERVLVVYGARTAHLYIESAPPSPPRRRRFAGSLRQPEGQLR